MTHTEWVSEVSRRIAVSEGSRSTMYHDSVGIPTIGIGFNLKRSDARRALQNCGVPSSRVDAVISGSQAITQEQIDALFAYSFAPIESEARDSLAQGIFDALTDARRFVICDLIFNLGNAGWSEFINTRSIINSAQIAKNTGNPTAHAQFVSAANALRASAWYTQVGYRAMRDTAMMEAGTFCDAQGDGSDIL